MEKKYCKQDYDNILQQYKDSKSPETISSVLSYLASYDIPDDDKDTFFFLNDLIKFVKTNSDEKSELQIREIANRIKNTSGSSMMRMVVLSYSVKTETDCIELIEECFKNNMYEYALDSIVDCICQCQEISTAVEILKIIKNRPEDINIADKQRIACQFIDRFDQMLKNDAEIRCETGLFGRYYSKTWEYFSHKDFKKYLSLRFSFKKRKLFVKKEESERQKNKRLAKENQVVQTEQIGETVNTVVKPEVVKSFSEKCSFSENAPGRPKVKINGFAEFKIFKAEITEISPDKYNYTFYCSFANFDPSYDTIINCYPYVNIRITCNGTGESIKLHRGNKTQVIKLCFSDKEKREMVFDFDIEYCGAYEFIYLPEEKRFM